MNTIYNFNMYQNIKTELCPESFVVVSQDLSLRTEE